MEQLVPPILPIFLFVACVIGLAVGLLVSPASFDRAGRVPSRECPTKAAWIRSTTRDAASMCVSICWQSPFWSSTSSCSSSIPGPSSPAIVKRWPLQLKGWALQCPFRAALRLNEKGRGGEGETRRPGDKEAGALGDKKSLLLSRSPSLPLSPSPPLRSSSAAEDRHLVFAAVMIFVALLTLGFVYDWRKGVFQWR